MRAQEPASRKAGRARIAARWADLSALAGIASLLALAGVILLQALARWLAWPILTIALADLPAIVAPLALALCLPWAGARAIAAARSGPRRRWPDWLAAVLLLLAAGGLFAYGWDLGPRRTIVADWPLAPVFLLASAGYALAALGAWRRR